MESGGMFIRFCGLMIDIIKMTISINTLMGFNRPGERSPEKDCWWSLMLQHPEQMSA